MKFKLPWRKLTYLEITSLIVIFILILFRPFYSMASMPSSKKLNVSANDEKAIRQLTQESQARSRELTQKIAKYLDGGIKTAELPSIKYTFRKTNNQVYTVVIIDGFVDDKLTPVSCFTVDSPNGDFYFAGPCPQ